MTQPASPLTPLPPDLKHKQKKVTETKTVMRRLLVPLTLTTILAFYLGSMPLILLGAVVWTGWGAYYLLVTKVLLPDGATTPSVNQHSNIETMEARGQYAEAAAAYRAVIDGDPMDIVSCEKLGQLAIRELKDFPMAVFAYREAEKRSPAPKRRLGYALLIAGIYRDNLKDNGKAVVELRRILATYPDAPNAARLRSELDELKATHFETP